MTMKFESSNLGNLSTPHAARHTLEGSTEDLWHSMSSKNETLKKLLEAKSKLAVLRMMSAAMEINRLLKKYDPNQPRKPAGTSEGGQWASIAGTRFAGKWDEGRRGDCTLQYERDMFQCRMMLSNPYCEDQARSRMTACMKGNDIPPFFHTSRRK
jgi:hypothetical protein